MSSALIDNTTVMLLVGRHIIVSHFTKSSYIFFEEEEYSSLVYVKENHQTSDLLCSFPSLSVIPVTSIYSKAKPRKSNGAMRDENQSSCRIRTSKHRKFSTFPLKSRLFQFIPLLMRGPRDT